MILGGLCVLIAAPFFAWLGPIGFNLVMLVPFVLACLKETGDWLKWWPHADSNVKQFMNDVAEWMFGALVFDTLLWILKFKA